VTEGPAERARVSTWLRRAGLLLAIWCAVAFAQAASQIVGRAPGDRPSFVHLLWSRGSIALAWSVFTPLVFLLATRVPPRTLRSIPVHLAAAAAVPASVAALAEVLYNLGLGSLFDPALDLLAETKAVVLVFFAPELLTYLELLVVALSIEASRKAGAAEVRARRLEAQVTEARVASLNLQLQPHFLFNTLNTLMPLISSSPATAERMLTQLGELFRVSLREASTLWALESELDFLSRYLDIQGMRYGARLTVDVFAQPGTESASVPPLVLQPLVENAIRHGIAAKPGAGCLMVRASREGPTLVLTVEDDGVGLPEDGSRVSRGVGLANTRTRLRQLFGDAQRLRLARREGGGVTARIEVPFRVHEDRPAA
jgi:two-component system, LytTR family, sensor kinase